GNSGGPLVDARGRLIGINTAIVGETYQGVSFSIPSDVSRTIYQRIRDNGHVQRGWLGVSLAEVPDKLHPGSNSRVRGALVEGFAGIDSPAELAGLQIGDVITSINEETIADVGHLMRIVGAAAVGAELQVDLRRDQASRSVNVQLGTRPNNLIP
ncbi:MAG: PDZ domain-containing protein, partial [Planctomycetota bacterium]